MIINTILITSYFMILTERYYNYGNKLLLSTITHSILLLFLLYVVFILYNNKNDEEIFLEKILDEQIDKAIGELNHNTDISIDKNDSIVEKNINEKTIIDPGSIYIIFGIFTFILILSFIFRRYVSNYLRDHYKSILFSVFIVGSIEFIFAYLIGTNSLKEKSNSDVTNLFLDNIKKYSNFN